MTTLRSLVLVLALAVLAGPALAKPPLGTKAAPAVVTRASSTRAVPVVAKAVPAVPVKVVLVAPSPQKAPVATQLAPQVAPVPVKAPASQAAPASAPSSQPAPAAWKAWFKANWPWIAGILLVALPGLITALAKYPKAKGVVAALQVALDFISILTHKDSPNTVKLPFTSSKPPAA